jgi:hypothetical protein
VHDAEAGYKEGDPVIALINGEPVEAVFERAGEPEEGDWVAVKAADLGYIKYDVAWVRRSDTGEVAAVLYAYLSPR